VSGVKSILMVDLALLTKWGRREAGR